MNVAETARRLCVDPTQGLSEKDVRTRRTLFGLNIIQRPVRLTKLAIMIRQFKSPLILVLVFAGLVTLFLKEWIDAGVIWAAVLVNTGLGFYQENKAETVLAELQSYIRTRVRVLRGGSEKEIDSEELLPGDCIHISQGDRIPADARIIYANNFETDEAVLTGESFPESKNSDAVPAHTPLADRTSMVYGGTLAVRGVARAIVTATGGMTEFGAIAALVQSEERVETPLQKGIARFAFWSGIALGFLVLILFFIGLQAGRPVFEMFLISVAVAVSAVPEGLPVALTVILAVGVQRLAAHKGVVRRLLAAETLGATSVILTDKTGTLTEARMELEEIIATDLKQPVENILEQALSTLDVVIENPMDRIETWSVLGHPIEQGLVRGAAQRGVVYPELRIRSEIIDRLPFSSEHKFSAAVWQCGPEPCLAVLGAPEIILRFSDLKHEEREALMRQIQRKTSEGKRVLGVLSKKLLTKPYHVPKKDDFKHMDFIGLLIFHDPLRSTAASAVERIRRAGIRTVIVTGDHQGTAEAVARELNILDGGSVLSGEDLRYLSPDELSQKAGTARVFARVVPQDKLRLVQAFRRSGEIVAVTGDGVNDAPALKEADIGVAVGSGTDIAKSAADLILLDDNFETLVLAIEEGRRILQNIRKAIIYLLSNSLAELFLIGGALLLGLPLPLNALQILYVNFFSDSFPALAFAFENGIDDHLKERIRKKPKLFDHEMKVYLLAIGALTSFSLFLAYAVLLRFDFEPALVRTFIFATFSSYTLVLPFALRSLKKSIFQYNPFSNKFLTFGISFGLLLIGAAIYIPFMQSVLGTVALPGAWLAAVAAIGLLNIALVESAKFFFRRYDGRRGVEGRANSV